MAAPPFVATRDDGKHDEVPRRSTGGNEPSPSPAPAPFVVERHRQHGFHVRAEGVSLVRRDDDEQDAVPRAK